jgi:uncharacterized protein (TIGR03118 family)
VSTRLTLESLDDRCLPSASSGYFQTPLSSDIHGLAAHFNQNLVNPWGFSETPDGQFRISANGSGTAPLLTAGGRALGPTVTLPVPPGSPAGATATPNGNVFNTTDDFVIRAGDDHEPATVLFSTEDGTIIGFNKDVDPTHGILAADESGSGAVFKLLAAGSANGQNYLYATDFHNGQIDVFDKNFKLVHLGGNFTDPTTGPGAIPAGFAPFGIKNIDGTLFITYAKQDAARHDDVEGVGNGFIDEFDTSGHFIARFASGGTLNSPIGMAVAPSTFGRFAGDLLVGNFGDSRVNAFDLKTGVFLGQLTDAQGNPLVLNGGFQETDQKGLWGIAFGNGEDGADPNALFFAAGINAENDGLFGRVDVAPAPKNQPAPEFVQSNLVSDVAGMAATQDKLLVNPWGVSFGAGSPFWVANNGTGTSTLYNGAGVPQPPGTNPPLTPLQVTIPNASGTTTPHGTPTGTVNNPLTVSDPSAFNVSATVNGVTKTGAAVFLFATLDGAIEGWAPGVNRTQAEIATTVPGASFTGLTIGTDAAGDTLLYAADNAHGTIDVFNTNFKLVTTLKGNFTDPNLPAGADPFNIQNIAGKLYVEYQVTGNPKVHGAVDVFTTDGTPVPNQLIVGGPLNSPWGVTLAPAGFGQFSNDLLVGNFGDGHINAFDPNSGKFLGTLTLANGQPFEEDHLWALTFGNGVTNNPTTLYFTAGINGQKDGLFGSIQAVTTAAKNAPLLPTLKTAAEQTVSTVPPTGTATPSNGDMNPYGAAFVPRGFEGQGELKAGDLLVSNFNNSSNVQGTGSTIIRITPDGQHTVFFQGSSQLGLTTALGVLKSGFVIVGSVPTDANGVAQQGELLILDANGKVVSTLSDSALLDGPWDLVINDQGDFAQVFVSNVLSGTITRIDLSIPDGGTPMVESETQIASGYMHRTDPNALVVGPTGLAYDVKTDTLYVASTADNAIYAISDAGDTQRDHGKGKLIFNDPNVLHGPLGMVLAPNGDLIIANGDAVKADPNHPNELVEITTSGKFVSQFQLDSGNPGAAFGLAVTSDNGVTRFAAVDDNTNTVHIWTVQQTPAVQHHHHHGEGGDDDRDDRDDRA